MPRYSFNLLPKAFVQSIRKRIDILKFYPIDFTYDLLHNRYLYQCKPILPSIDDAKIKEYISSLSLDDMSHIRNKLGTLIEI